MSPPVSLRYLFPPGSIRALVVYGLCLGLLGIVRYFNLSDFFLSKELMDFLTIVAVVFVPIAIINYFHPEWRDWSKNDNFGAD
jgi:H+/Cl- antiporter ClcA